MIHSTWELGQEQIVNKKNFIWIKHPFHYLPVWDHIEKASPIDQVEYEKEQWEQKEKHEVESGNSQFFIR